MRTLGSALLVIAVLAALGAPALAPHRTDETFGGLLNAPPTLPHIAFARDGWHGPFIYRSVLVNQLEQRYEEDRSAPIPLIWMAGGRLVQSSDESRAPLMLLGTDSFGRDVFSRLLFGARVSLLLAVVAALGAMLLGTPVGGVAGYVGGATDDVLMRFSDFVLVLPATYVVLALRSVLPLVLAPATVFALLASIFAIVGAPFIARGVRAIVRSERRLDYAVAAASLGAGPARVLVRHLLPAARGFLVVELTLLVPAFIVAEATLVVRRARLPRPDRELGHDAARRVEHSHVRRLPVAAEPGRRHVPGRARLESAAPAIGCPAGRPWRRRRGQAVGA